MWCERPLLATVVAIFTPVFLVSSSTLMCDVLMLAFWIWALVFWERALANGQSRWQFVGAGLLAGLAVLTKYSAVTLLPLLPFLSILRTRRSGWWLVGMAVPLIMVAAYEWITAGMYGKGLLFAAAGYAQTYRSALSQRLEGERNHKSGLCRWQPAAAAVLCAIPVATAGLVGRWRGRFRAVAGNVLSG